MATTTLSKTLVHNAVAVRSGSGWLSECTCSADLGGARLKRWAQASADSHLRVALETGGAVALTAVNRLGLAHRTMDGYAVRAAEGCER